LRSLHGARHQLNTHVSIHHQGDNSWSAGGAGNSVTKQAKQQLSKASKLTSCVAAAGTDPSKVEACQSKYAGS
jgi:hypothetical protein